MIWYLLIFMKLILRTETTTWINVKIIIDEPKVQILGYFLIWYLLIFMKLILRTETTTWINVKIIVDEPKVRRLGSFFSFTGENCICSLRITPISSIHFIAMFPRIFIPHSIHHQWFAAAINMICSEGCRPR